MDNRHALIVNCRVTQATGTGERDAAKAMAAEIPGAHRKTLGADKNYDTKGMVADLRWIGVAPHVAQNTARPGGSAIDGRTTRHKVSAVFGLHVVAYNLIRLGNLLKPAMAAA